MQMSDAIRPAPAPGPAPSKLKVFFAPAAQFLVLWTVVLTALFSSNRLVSDYVFLVIMVFLAATGWRSFTGWWPSGDWFASSDGAFLAACC